MPSSHRDLFPSVDEKRALEQLEKFQREIQSARWKREQASAEFETFVKGFGEGRESEQSSNTDAASQQPRPAAPSLVRAMRRHSVATPPRPPEQPAAAGRTPAEPAVPRPPSASVRPQPAVAPVPAAESAAIASETPSYSMRLERWRGRALVGAALVAIVLLAIGWWKNMPSEPTRESRSVATTPQPAATQPAATQPSAAPAAIPEPAAATPPVPQRAATLSATRRVWVRVMADGHRLFERELTAGESLPLDATQAFVIRAGDAGAVRITFADGRSETLGAEGQVVTKRFELKR